MTGYVSHWMLSFTFVILLYHFPAKVQNCQRQNRPLYVVPGSTKWGLEDVSKAAELLSRYTLHLG